ncbi:MAG: helix-turn-helix domain-containing protein [Candidatus Woesearchaeota archaeon]
MAFNDKKHAMDEKRLEYVIDERLRQAIDSTLLKYGLPIANSLNQDITNRISKSSVLLFDPDTSIPFKKAKRLFKKYYLEKLLKIHGGNISSAAKAAGIDRRSLHRLISTLNISVERKGINRANYQTNTVSKIFEDVLEGYKRSASQPEFRLNHQEITKLYRLSPTLSRELVKHIPSVTLKEAEEVFEQKFLKQALERNNKNISRTARAIGIRFESLHRKLKEIGLRNNVV